MKEISAAHPLFHQLRNDLFWHCTSPAEFRQIRSKGLILPNDGRVEKWGPLPYACQELGGVSLFDFNTESEARVLESADRWQQFFECSHPVTIVLGLQKSRLRGNLVPDPQNKEGTTGNVIPWVEVCHCGAIPTSAVVQHILVCAIDFARFYVEPHLDEQKLRNVESEFQSLADKQAEKCAHSAAKIRAFNEQLEQRRRSRKDKP